MKFGADVKIKNVLVALFVFILPLFAWAYIPPYWMILSRTADNHGKGIYVIDQDVVFTPAEGDPMIINERWTVQNEFSMRLDVTGKRQMRNLVRLTYVYQNNRRYFIDENGVKKAEKAPNDFFEPYFHFRLSKNIKPILVAQDIAPAVSLKSEPHRYSQKKPTAETEPYVRLARVGGAVTYAIGSATPVSSAEPYAGLWIEQDQFLIRKLRLPSQLEISADQYKNFSNGLWLPHERRVAWPGFSARILVNNVSATAATPKIKSSLEGKQLNFGEDPNLQRVLPDDAAIRDFYSRMR